MGVVNQPPQIMMPAAATTASAPPQQSSLQRDGRRRSDLDVIRQHLLRTRTQQQQPSSAPLLLPSAKLRLEEIASGMSRPASSPSPLPDGTRTTPTRANSQITKSPSLVRALAWSLMRSMLIKMPLLVVVSLLHCILFGQTLYHDYWNPLMKAAGRAKSNAQLRREFTYYNRICTAADVTTTRETVGNLLLTGGSRGENSNATTTTVTTQQAVDNMMIHGASLFPQILKPSTVTQLRAFISKRNSELTGSERIPMDQGYHRLSFGIDATEDPVVWEALREIGTHTLLQATMEGLVGPNPAVTEITAITAWEGCGDQVYHSDTKSDGNSVRFGRTYSHSYSLFVPLQDTTGDMGATELCPGTHYCNNWAGDMCEKNGFQLNEASPDGVWHAGDAALLNQQVFHRGYRFTRKNALRRIVFIVSFIGRPNLGSDPRQLARGTYFHMKWNMWGHVWHDLLDAKHRMGKVVSILRCFGIWKPPASSWGYDLVTSAFMRIANQQNGMHYSDLPTQIEDFGLNAYLPSWLHGPIRADASAHPVYIEATLNNIEAFLREVQTWLVRFYLVLTGLSFIIACYYRSLGRWAITSSLSFAIIFGMPFLLYQSIQHRLETSEWATNIRTGKTLMPPFSAKLARLKESPIPVSVGPTTRPERQDVLFASRFDSTFLGAYEHWIDYHPGNMVYSEAIQHVSPYISRYAGLPTAFHDALVESIIDTVDPGRFLMQDWRTGNWLAMTEEEATEFIWRDLKAQASPPLSDLDRTLKRLIARIRFDVSYRESHLALNSQRLLGELRRMIYERLSPGPKPGTAQKEMFSNPLRIPSYLRFPSITSVASQRGRTPEHERWSNIDYLEALAEGETVMVQHYEGGWFMGTIVESNDETASVTYEDGEVDHDIELDRIVRNVYLVEGTRVWGYYDRGKQSFPATVIHVRPDGRVDLRYDDGDTETNVKSKYYQFLLE